MKTITLAEPAINPAEQNAKYGGKTPDPKTIAHWATDPKESVRMEAPNTGMIATVVRGGLPAKQSLAFYRAITQGRAIQQTNNRGQASGQKPRRRIKKDGTPSNTSRTPESIQSSIVGFYDRYPRINYCRSTAWVLKHPEKWAAMEEYASFVNEVFREFCPAEHAQHTAFSGRTSPDFLIKGTAFTTITLNRNFQTKSHRDQGNLPEGYAAMSYFKRGRFSGGEVVFPAFGAAVRLYNHDLIIFKNTELHGNLPIVPATAHNDYERLTAVFFYRQNMIYCGTAEEELHRAKRNKGDQIIGPVTEDLNQGRWS